MGRYGPPPEAPAPPPPPTDDDNLTRWSFRRKVLAILAGVGMVGAFVFNFMDPTSSGFREDTTTTAPATSVPGQPTTTDETTATTAFSTTVPGGVVSR